VFFDHIFRQHADLKFVENVEDSLCQLALKVRVQTAKLRLPEMDRTVGHPVDLSPAGYQAAIGLLV